MGLISRFNGLEGEDKKTKYNVLPFPNDTTNQPYIPVHNPNALQTLGQIGADSTNTLINFSQKMILQICLQINL